MSIASRLPAILLLGLVVLAAALLIAGYGAAIGIGVIAGMLLGLGAILAFLAMRPHTSGGSSISLLSSSGSPAQSDHERIQRQHLAWMRVAGVDASALRHVLAAGEMVEAAGVRVELIAVEIREHGGVAMMIAHTHPPVGQTGHFVEVTVTDDARTEYAAAGQGSGGGNVGTNRYDVRFAPAPPSGATVLTIRIESFTAPYPVPEEQIDGPWEFRIPL
jgi:hypothetical protein